MAATFSARLAPALVSLAALGAAAGAQSLPQGFEAVPLPGTYQNGVGIAFMSGGGAFIIRQDGRVNVNTGAVAQGQLFIDLRDEVNQDGDRGLIGIAVHPGFLPDDGPTSWVYLLYTVSPVPGDDVDFDENDQYSFSRLTRYRAQTVNGRILADQASRQVLLGNQLPDGSVPDAIASLHNSHSNGSIVFGTDGTLLLFTGDGGHYDLIDGGGADDPGFDDWIHPVTGLRGPTPKEQDHGAYRAQMLNTLAGKVLRIDPETGLGLSSNPFYDGDPASNASRVWALGLRNPYRGSLMKPGSTDPALGDPGVLVLGDVGWADWEEVDVCSGGENFGWPCHEAAQDNDPYLDYDPPGGGTQPCEGTPVGSLTLPLASWSHQDAADYTPLGTYVAEDGTPLPEGFLGACAAGATAYLGGGYPDEYDGRVFFADYAAGWIKTIELDANGEVVALRPFYQTTSTLTEVARHPITGDLYFLSNFGGKLTKLRYVDPAWVKTIGCGMNPPGSLVFEEPMAEIGATVHFTLDNPLGTQSAGAATVLALSAAPDAAYPCGTPIPAFGMAGLGALGELLINPLPGAVFDPVPGPPWKAAPTTIAIKVPFLFTLVGQKVYLQGAIVDTTFGGGTGAGIGLTEALELVIGS